MPSSLNDGSSSNGNASSDPVLVDDRLRPWSPCRSRTFLTIASLLGGQDLGELIEVAVRRGQRLRRFLHWCRCRRDGCRHCCCRCHATAPLVPRQVSLFSRMTSYDQAVRAIPRMGDRVAMPKGDAKEMAGQQASGRHGRKKSKTVPTSAGTSKSPRLARGQAPAATGARAAIRPMARSHVRLSRIVLTFRRDPPMG